MLATESDEIEDEIKRWAPFDFCQRRSEIVFYYKLLPLLYAMI